MRPDAGGPERRYNTSSRAPLYQPREFDEREARNATSLSFAITPSQEDGAYQPLSMGYDNDYDDFDADGENGAKR